MPQSCRRLSTLFDEEPLIARVGESKLHKADLRTIFAPGMTEQDSVKLLERYVEAWVKRQLKIQQAERLFPESAPDIERMVEDYRSSLLTYRLDQFYVDSRLDTMIAPESIEAFYNEHRSDFMLDRAIVKGVVVRLPADHRQRVQVRELMAGSGDKYQDFLELSRKNGFTVREFTAWTDFADFLNALPLSRLGSHDELLEKTTVQEMPDGGDVYYVLITESRRAGDAMPIERVSETIRRVITNQRRQEIVRSYEDSIYNAALSTRDVEIRIGN